MTEPRREIELLGTLGRGGFGTVYLANLHGRDGFVRRVAVKVLKDGLEREPQILARQRDEARLLGRLAHDHIVQVLDLTELAGRPAVVMEYVEGVDLSVLQGNGERVPTRVALQIVAAAASALDAAWTAPDPSTGQPLHVIHRDIKPPNLFLTPGGGVKVLDFGIARADFDREGHTTAISYGTPRYMAPEQWLQEPFGAPVDVYALGVVLAELLTGRPWERPPLVRPGFENHVGALVAAIDVPEDVRALLLRMVSFAASERPSAAEVQERAAELAESIGGEGLARFARRVVPPLVEARRAELAVEPRPELLTSPRDATGMTLGAPPPPRDVVPWGLRLAGMAVGLVATALIAVGAGGGAWWWLHHRDGAAVADAAAAPAEVADGVVEPVGEPVAEPVAEPIPAPPTVADASPAPPDPGAAAPRSRRSSAPAEPDAPVRILAPASAPPETAPAAPTAQPVAASTPQPAAATWALQVTSEPMGAEVWVDGARVGVTPDAHVRLTAGRHTVVVSQAGARAEREIVVGADTPGGLRYYFTTGTWRTIR